MGGVNGPDLAAGLGRRLHEAAMRHDDRLGVAWDDLDQRQRDTYDAAAAEVLGPAAGGDRPADPMGKPSGEPWTDPAGDPIGTLRYSHDASLWAVKVSVSVRHALHWWIGDELATDEDVQGMPRYWHPDVGTYLASHLAAAAAAGAGAEGDVRPGVAGNGAYFIAQERKRQREGEGWTPEHDDQHIAGELAAAANVYLDGHDEHTRWPWPDTGPKFRGRVNDLLKAGALIAAEVDRLLRLDARAAEGHSVRDRLAGDEGLTGDEQLAVSPDAARCSPGGDS